MDDCREVKSGRPPDGIMQLNIEVGQSVPENCMHKRSRSMI